MLTSILLFFLMLSIPSAHAEEPLMSKNWPGFAILGNGSVCAVYSDHPGPFPKSTLRGIQHLYYRDYTADYVASTTVQLLDPSGTLCPADPERTPWTGMHNFFTTLTTSHFSDGIQLLQRACAHPNDAVLLTFQFSPTPADHSYLFHTRLLRRLITDREILMNASSVLPGGATFSWSNGVSLAIGTHSGEGIATLDDIGLTITGPGDAGPVVIIIAAGASPEEALGKLAAIREQKDPLATAEAHWTAWLKEGEVPDLEEDDLVEAYCRNLYAARAACLDGQIPADITGQFRTHNMPQLYPRDALMCARVFLLTGHQEEARQVLTFWAETGIPQKSPGEWYARYDAHGQAVDAGSGARYDEPEWDANGYVIQLAADDHSRTGQWPVERSFLFQLADFLAGRIDDNGLLFEGGIVEWSGYLPATNMIAAASLQTASRMAADDGDDLRSEHYAQVSERIGSSLEFLFDDSRDTYADVRYAGGKAPGDRSPSKTDGETLFLWDTSANFGILWGYPDHAHMRSTNEFYARHCVRDNGGLQYFDSPDPGLAGYGHDLFFFTTAAAAQYHARYGDPGQARRHIDWMLRNANVYGLMPERIYLNGTGCSQASPLSWCCAELAAALLEYSRADRRGPAGEEPVR